MSVTHYADLCATHGTVLSQCRCPGPRTVRRRPCPGEEICANLRAYAYYWEGQTANPPTPLEDAFDIIHGPDSNDVRLLRVARELALMASHQHDAFDHARYGESDGWSQCQQPMCRHAADALADAGLDPRTVL